MPSNENPYASSDLGTPQGRLETDVVDRAGAGSFLLLLLQPVVAIVLLCVMPIYHGTGPPPIGPFRKLVAFCCLVELAVAPVAQLLLSAYSVALFRRRRKFRYLGVITLIVTILLLGLFAVNWLFPSAI